VNGLRHSVSVKRSTLHSVKNEKIESALQKAGFDWFLAQAAVLPMTVDGKVTDPPLDCQGEKPAGFWLSLANSVPAYANTAKATYDYFQGRTYTFNP